MGLVKNTNTGINYLQKTNSEAHASQRSSIQYYNKQVGSDGVGNIVFNIGSAYVMGSDTLCVFVQGQKATKVAVPSSATEYAETDSSTITFGAALGAADIVEFVVFGNYVLNDVDVGVIQRGDAECLTQLLHPSENGGWPDIYRGGWEPWSFNQFWGGPQWGPLPDGSEGDIATGFLESLDNYDMGHSLQYLWVGNSFKVSENITLKEIWLPLHKCGNPTDNIFLTIEDARVNGTAPGLGNMIANGQSISIPGEHVEYGGTNYYGKFTFPTPPSLTANTEYTFMMNRSGPADAVNYYSGRAGDDNYPHGYSWYFRDDTNVWVGQPFVTGVTPGFCQDFLIVSESSEYFLQPGGQFDSKLAYKEGNPIDQSKALTQHLNTFFNDEEFTALFRGSDFTKDKTFMDFVYGLEHDRIVIRCNAVTGLAQVDLFEKDRTRHTILGISDISVGFHDISIVARMKNDGADYLYLYINGVLEKSLTGQSFEIDSNFKELGTAWLGGGFPIISAWTLETNMNELPSTVAGGSWTWTNQGTGGIESDTWSVVGGKLYQNAAGTGPVNRSFYERAPNFNNANGWIIEWKMKAMKDFITGSALLGTCSVTLADQTNAVNITMEKYFVRVNLITPANDKVFNYQIDLSKKEHVFVAMGKDSDFYLFIDGKLVVDGTGKFVSSDTSNTLYFGDVTSVLNRDGDSIWDYFRYNNSGWELPEFTEATQDEFAFWTKNKTSLLPFLYNEGSPISVKTYCGVPEDYIKTIGQTLQMWGIETNPSTSYIWWTTLPEMNCYSLCFNKIELSHYGTYHNTVAGGYVRLAFRTNTIVNVSIWGQSTIAGDTLGLSMQSVLSPPPGLHWISVGFTAHTGGGNAVASDKNRVLTITQQGEKISTNRSGF